jgi:hypothetical protein
MAKIEVQLHYYPREESSYAWEHRKLGEKAEIKEEDMGEVAKRFGVIINIKEERDIHLPLEIECVRVERDPTLKHWFPRGYKTIISVFGNEEFRIRDCVRTLLETYGVPDEVPKGFFGGKKKGGEIVRSVLEEIGLA